MSYNWIIQLALQLSCNFKFLSNIIFSKIYYILFDYRLKTFSVNQTYNILNIFNYLAIKKISFINKYFIALFIIIHKTL